jgi:hypothetical protein
MPGSERAAIGCRSHSGWAALVAIAGLPNSPLVIDRRRIETCDPANRGSKQPYHAAESLELRDAAALLKRCSQSTAQLSLRALRAAIEDLRGIGYRVESCGLTLGSGRALPELKKILASHALLHTAEGEFYRDALAGAGKECGLTVCGVKEKELVERGADHFRITPDELDRRLIALGKPIGAPWTQDQKYAALVAWMALTNYRSER